MDNHDKAHYTIGALAFVAAGASGFYTAEKPNVTETRIIQSIGPHDLQGPSTEQLSALKTWIDSEKKRPIRFVCGGQCSAFAENVEQVFDNAGWETNEEMAFGSGTGLVVSPSNDENRKLADGISKTLSIPVKVLDLDTDGLALFIGRKATK